MKASKQYHNILSAAKAQLDSYVEVKINETFKSEYNRKLEISVKMDFFITSGSYILNDNELKINMSYSIARDHIIIKHINENGEEYINIDCPTGWTANIYHKNGHQNKVFLERRHRKEISEWYSISKYDNMPFYFIDAYSSSLLSQFISAKIRDELNENE